MTIVHGRPASERREAAQSPGTSEQPTARDWAQANQVQTEDQERRLRQIIEQQAQLFAAWRRSRKGAAEGGGQGPVQAAKKPRKRKKKVIVEQRTIDGAEQRKRNTRLPKDSF